MGPAQIIATSARFVFRGGKAYWLWISFLLAMILWGGSAYIEQLRVGMIVTNMRDQVSWAFYIGNFTFLVGVAAAAVVLVIPAYIYHWGPIKEVAILGEILAVSAIIMCLLFVVVDIGRPDRGWHLIPFIGHMNFPSSVLAWDVLVLNLYLVLNLVIVGHLLYRGMQGRHYNQRLVVPLVLFSIPAAVGIHTVTAFIYAGLPGRPYWNASILAPRFLCSAFCSGPAVMVVLFQILQRTTNIAIKDAAIRKVAELMAYAMFINLFLLGAEIFKEYYSATEHLIHFQYLFAGVRGHHALVPYAWAFVGCGIVAFLLFLFPTTRRNVVTLNLGCLLIYASVYIEKGMGLVMPAFTPDTLGEIYEYTPTIHELRIGAAIFSIGFLVFTVLCRIAIPILTGEFAAARTAAVAGKAPHWHATPAGAGTP
ncbi:MAG TPA: NrfD/PsrC family molybdoenzyme membrane anchor subunit [Candidatus Margulisiibacteriota bacterium]|nr:NrfD/PsrC family molybdoenzyme membrane anchor subunit [Candidatus Margulisiibacteriota bacterium]